MAVAKGLETFVILATIATGGGVGRALFYPSY